MNWFIVVYFLVNGAWIEADKMGKEGWSPILQKDYYTCIEKINESNKRFQKIAEYREIELDIKFIRTYSDSFYLRQYNRVYKCLIDKKDRLIIYNKDGTQ